MFLVCLSFRFHFLEKKKKYLFGKLFSKFLENNLLVLKQQNGCLPDKEDEDKSVESNKRRIGLPFQNPKNKRRF